MSELIVVVTGADGNTKTLDSNAPDPGDRPRGIQFSSQRGSGFYTGSFTLSRAIDRDSIDLNLLDDVTIRLANGDTVYEGYITNLPRSTGSDGHTITVELSGYMASAIDQPFSEVFVDRDLSKWGGASTSRRADLLGIGVGQITDPSVLSDAAGRSVLRTGFTGAWTPEPIAEAWYDAGSGNTLGVVHVFWTRSGPIDPLDTNWSWAVYLTNDDRMLTHTTTGNLRAAGPGPTDALSTQRYAVLQLNYNVPAGGAGQEYAIDWSQVAVYGSHGLSLVGTETPYGVAASDVVRFLVGRYCPMLNTDGVQDTTYPISQLVFSNSTVYDALLKVNSYHIWDIAVWENRTLHFAPLQDLDEWDWEIRHDEVGNQVGLQGDSATELRNGIIVTYTDVATGREERLHPTDHAELRDDSIDHPANRHGRPMYGTPYAIPFPTTEANALELGRVKLVEDNQAKAPGSFTVGPWITDRAGVLHPVSMVRSGQRIRVTSSANLSDRARTIAEVNYSHDGQTATISVDSTLAYLEGLIDRTTTALTAAGLS